MQTPRFKDYIIAICTPIFAIFAIPIIFFGGNFTLDYQYGSFTIVAGWALILFSLILAALTAKTIIGEGLAAAKDPTVRLIIKGPYRYNNAPLATSVVYILLGEILLTGAFYIGPWLLAYIALAGIYDFAYKRPVLIKKFGRELILDYFHHAGFMQFTLKPYKLPHPPAQT